MRELSTASTLKQENGQSMSSLIRHDYLKSAMEERLNRNTEEIVLTRALPPKDNITKAFELRSQSVAHSIKKSDYES